MLSPEWEFSSTDKQIGWCTNFKILSLFQPKVTELTPKGGDTNVMIGTHGAKYVLVQIALMLKDKVVDNSAQTVEMITHMLFIHLHDIVKNGMAGFCLAVSTFHVSPTYLLSCFLKEVSSM